MVLFDVLTFEFRLVSHL